MENDKDQVMLLLQVMGLICVLCVLLTAFGEYLRFKELRDTLHDERTRSRPAITSSEPQHIFSFSS